MSHHFKVGEMVIMQNASYFNEYNGYPAIVVGDYDIRNTLDLSSMVRDENFCYQVEILKGPDCLSGEEFVVCAKPHQLRRPDNKPSVRYVREKFQRVLTEDK